MTITIKSNKLRNVICGAALLLAAVPPAVLSAGQGGGSSSLPAGGGQLARTPWGDPDIGGQWLNNDPKKVAIEGTDNIEIGVPEEEIETEKLIVPAFVPLIEDPPDGKIPYRPWARAKQQDRNHKFLNPPSVDYIPTGSRCLLYGVPGTMYREGPEHVFQFRNYILIVWEYPAMHRIIWTDGRPPLPPQVKLWQGFSVGHWEGDTLVVKTTNQNGFPWTDWAGNFLTDTAVVTERFAVSQRDFGPAIQYSATIEDPSEFTRPWTVGWRITRPNAPRGAVIGRKSEFQTMPRTAPTQLLDEILEVACVEGERPHTIAAMLGHASKNAAKASNAHD